jgi:hypothetical protein
VIVRTSAEMVRVTAFEIASPGFATVMLAVPAVAISEAGRAAVSWELVTKVVVRLDPFHLTTELDTKLVPLTVNVKASPPADTVLGLMLVSVGTEAEITRVKDLFAVWGVG